jgi:NAD(P)H-dependent FMN reductase
MKIVGIAGSLRKGSLNAALLRAAAELAPSSMQIETATLHGIPLYDGDVEAEHGAPDAVQTLKERIADSDGLLLVTPEYNNSIPGVFKNGIDWLTRPSKDMGRVFGGKPVALMGASPGPGGTRLAQLAWLPVLRMLKMRPFFDRSITLGRARDVFDDQGALTDESTRDAVRAFLEGFADFVGKR